MQSRHIISLIKENGMKGVFMIIGATSNMLRSYFLILFGIFHEIIFSKMLLNPLKISLKCIQLNHLWQI